jgi:plastocyanin
MRLVRLSAVTVMTAVLLALVLAVPALAKPAGAAHTYTVLVGAENVHRGVDVMSYFPDKITIHVGDTVRWVQNSNEIHTVTFGADPLPPLLVPTGIPSTPLAFNPVVFARTPVTSLGNTTTYANSGIMGTEPGQDRSFTLTFTAADTYHYACAVHGMMMSGTVNVVAAGVAVPSPGRTAALGHFQIAREMAKAPAVIRQAESQVQPATKKADGTLTHHISIGYSSGQIDLMSFFPSKVNVRPGDRVEWTLSSTDQAPHTVTFLNGAQEPGLIMAGGETPPVLYVNPAVLFPTPIPPTPPTPPTQLTRTGLFNSGLLDPTSPMKSYSIVVGNVTPGPLKYLCLLHDTSGMKGSLTVLPH